MSSLRGTAHHRVQQVQESAANVVAVGGPRTLGGDAARLRFGEEAKTDLAWKGRRLLSLDGRAAFELSFWCGTCPFLFKRLEGANATASLADLASRLAMGIDDLDEHVIDRFGELLPRGEYLPLLLRVRPRLVRPLDKEDYFAKEQVVTWGLDSFWGLPQYPQTPYYRTYEAPMDSDAHLFEFVVPMVPPSWNDRERVEEHSERLVNSSRATAVAVSLLDVCEPAVVDGSQAGFAHWALTHFLLDGHHKIQAAADLGKPIQLLSLLSIDASLATPDQVKRVP
jgi:hypothetical protein